MVPPGAHREPGVRGEIETETGQVVGEQQENRERHDGWGESRPAEAYAKSLRNRANDVHFFRRDIGEDGTGPEYVQQSDNRRSEEDRALEMASGIAGFSGEDGGIFESAEGTERHLAEDAELKEG